LILYAIETKGMEFPSPIWGHGGHAEGPRPGWESYGYRPGYDTLDGYEKGTSYFGATVGDTGIALRAAILN